MKRLLASVLAVLASSGPALAQRAPAAALAELTRDEKVSLVTGLGFSLDDTPVEGTDAFVPGVAGYTLPVPRLGVPSLALADGPAGIRLSPGLAERDPPLVATAFPIATALASSWDEALVREVGEAIGAEALAYGIDVVLAPGMNLQRHPLGGRNYEYYAEDPVLSGYLAAAMVRGIQSEGVGATLKHFVANNQETNRTALDTIVDEATLRALYLRGFEIAVREGEPLAVMTAYNLLNGTHTSQDRRLLTDILRGEWGFEGIVMTDWFAGDDPAAQIAAGHDLLMPGTARDRAAITAALDSGQLSAAALDRAALSVLRAALASPSARGEGGDADVDLAAHAALARRAAGEGAVLLENSGVLPFTDDIRRLALFGVGSYAPVTGGTGSGDVAEAYVVGLDDAAAQAGYDVDEGLRAAALAHVAAARADEPARTLFDPVPPLPEIVPAEAAVARAAKDADAAILTISRITGEFADRAEADDFLLTRDERALMERVSAAFRAEAKPVVVVLNVGGPVETRSWAALADAVLVTWLSGQEAGQGALDVLRGRVAPSGHLTATWPLALDDLAASANFPGRPTVRDPVPAYAGFGTALPSRVAYEEGQLVGYRDALTNSLPVAYPFGHGLHYTDFEHTDLSVTSGSRGVTVSVMVRNVGAAAGSDVAQIYVAGPGAEGDDGWQLKGFAKTGTLPPGEVATLSVVVPWADLAAFDHVRGWRVRPGPYRVAAGTSALRIGPARVLDVPAGR